MSALETASDSLLSVINPLRDKLSEARETVARLENELAPLEAAFDQLQTGRKASKKPGRKASKPCARKQDVLDVCLALVEANQPIAKDDLVSLAKHKLSAEGGFNLSGVALRLSECLSSDAFAVSDDQLISLGTSPGNVIPS